MSGMRVTAGLTWREAIRRKILFAAVLIGLALLVGSVGLWFGFALFLVFILWFVPLYEEPDMLRRFGDEYRGYCAEVPRWFPRILHRHAPHRATPAPR